MLSTKNILAHRGFWLKPTEQNTLTAFKRALDSGFGIETDLRDSYGRVVIAHDLPLENSLLAEDFFALYETSKVDSLLALNIKSDGLQSLLFQTLQKHKVKNYFLFDMSVPDHLRSQKQGLICFTRQSDIEEKPLPLYNSSAGLWIDGFERDWQDFDQAFHHVQQGKQVALVSPELHRRAHLEWWKVCKENLAMLDPKYRGQISLCTDFPADAQEFFSE